MSTPPEESSVPSLCFQWLFILIVYLSHDFFVADFHHDTMRLNILHTELIMFFALPFTISHVDKSKEIQSHLLALTPLTPPNTVSPLIDPLASYAPPPTLPGLLNLAWGNEVVWGVYCLYFLGGVLKGFEVF